MRLIVGLGNVGAKYEDTRHNVGFKVIDQFLAKQKLTLNETKFSGEFLRTKDFIIAKPSTFMNASGSFVGQLARFYQIDFADILIVYDDVSHPLGAIAMKPSGSSGGHNGIKDIIEKLGTDKFLRLKIGIGTPRHNLVDHVLTKFLEHETTELGHALQKAERALELFIANGAEKTMQWVNTKQEATSKPL